MNGWGMTDKGIRAQNQDCFALELVEGKDVALCVVCDGMGGASAGNVASSIAAEGFMDDMKLGLMTAKEVAELSGRIRHAASYANSMVYEVARAEPDYLGMGTTLVAALVVGDYASVINIGDSRAYIISPDAISMVTRDHSVVQDMIDRGDLTREEALRHPDKNLITRALGVDETVLCDVFEIRFNKGDCLLLCTDGLTNFVDEQRLLEEVGKVGERAGCCRRLIDVALRAGSADNITALLLEK